MGILHKNTTAAGLTNPAASAETAFYTTPAVQTGQGDGAVAIAGTVYVTAGTGATAITLRCYKGPTIAGVLLQALPAVSVVAGNLVAISFGFTDTSPFTEAAGGGQYTVSAQQTAGTGAGTANAIDIEVLV